MYTFVKYGFSKNIVDGTSSFIVYLNTICNRKKREAKSWEFNKQTKRCVITTTKAALAN